MLIMESSLLAGAYTAERAAGLAGVPLRTLYYWAGHEILEPSISRFKPRRWSYADVVALRLIDWLRKDKEQPDVSRTSMRQIRVALGSFTNIGEKLERGLTVLVEPSGRVVLAMGQERFVPLGKRMLQGLHDLEPWDLLMPYRQTGPDLRRPRPTLRLIPGKLSGEPHVVDTRIETAVLAALAKRGFEGSDILELYPFLTDVNVREAMELEEQISFAA